MNLFIIYSIIAIVILIISGLCFGHYQANLYLDANKLFLLLGIILLAISVAAFYFAYEEYNNINLQKELAVSGKETILDSE